MAESRLAVLEKAGARSGHAAAILDGRKLDRDAAGRAQSQAPSATWLGVRTHRAAIPD